LRKWLCPEVKPKREVTIPDVSDLIKLEDLLEVDPYSILYNLGYSDVVVADIKYLSVPKKKWKKLLLRIYDSIRPLEEYIPELFDCDDYATIFSSLVILTFYTNFKWAKHQLAFGIAWSNIHAFNLFIDNEERVWVYEPQNNRIVGEIHEVKEGIYKVKKVWFMG